MRGSTPWGHGGGILDFLRRHGELLRSNSADFPPRRGLLGRCARLGRGFGFGFPFAHRVTHSLIAGGVFRRDREPSEGALNHIQREVRQRLEPKAALAHVQLLAALSILRLER